MRTIDPRFSRRQLIQVAAGAGIATVLTNQPAMAQEDVELRVVGFRVAPEEQGIPLDEAYQEFLANFQEANPGITIDALETPPEFDTQLLVDLATGTAPDVWAQDSASLAPLIANGSVLDMRQAVELVPEFDLDRFWPNVLELHKRDDGSIYGVPNDFTPVMIYYNPEVFEKTGVDVPQPGWTWDDLLETAKLMTLDSEGRNRNDPNFDADNVVQWGYRSRQYYADWLYRVWENGGDVISPDGTTTKGYLDSPETIEAIQWHADLLLVHGVSPTPNSMDQLNQSGPFTDRFLKGEFAMYDRGHWELVGLQASPEYRPERVAVVGQPKKINAETVIWESSFVINSSLEGAKLEAACKFVEAATSPEYQDTKVLTGIAISGIQESAEAAVEVSALPEIEQAFIDEIPNGRPSVGATHPNGFMIDERLTSMMERILNGSSVEDEVARTIEEIDREL